MKQYIVYDDYKIGYIEHVCKCEKCVDRGLMEVMIRDLDDGYLDCFGANEFDRVVYVGESLSDAIKETVFRLKSENDVLAKENKQLNNLINIYSLL